MNIGDWLRSLGLERYEAAFRENEINEKVLPKLTAEDFKDMGIGIVGGVPADGPRSPGRRGPLIRGDRAQQSPRLPAASAANVRTALPQQEFAHSLLVKRDFYSAANAIRAEH
jgi:hypothetical protein